MPRSRIQKSIRYRDQVVDAVMDLLQAGTLSPGERVTEEGLVQRLSVSRTPIREALSQLAHRGALQVRPSGGFAVPLPTVDELHDTIAVRLLLEPQAVRMAAREFGPREVAEIDRAIEGEVASLTDPHPLRFARANEAYRVSIFGAIRNKVLSQTIAQFNSHLQFIRASTLKNLTLREKIVERQSRIRDAIAANEADEAEAKWQSYLRYTEDSLRNAIRDWAPRSTTRRKRTK